MRSKGNSIHTRAHKKSLGQIAWQVLYGHAVVSAPPSIKLKMMVRRKMSAKIVLVSASCVQDDGTFRWICILDQFLRLNGTDRADVGKHGKGRGCNRQKEKIPHRYIAAATGLGLSQTQVVWAVLLKQSWGGLISESLLGLARAAAETAPIMLTATIFAGATFSKGVVENPVLPLPYHIFILAQDSFAAGVETKMWGAALVLLGLVFSMSLAALPSRLYLHEESDV